MSNSGPIPRGNVVYHTIEDEMAAYDRLPAPVRLKFSFLAYKVETGGAYRAWRSGMGSKEIMDRLDAIEGGLMAEAQAAKEG